MRNKIISIFIIIFLSLGIIASPALSTTSMAATVTGEQIVAELRTHCGKTPYVYGGNSWSGTDCSGMICLAYEKFGINLWPWRTDFIGGLSSIGTNVGVDPKNARSGDLVIFSGHCAIAVDSKTCIQCQCSTGVTERSYSYMQTYFSPIKMIIRPRAINSQPVNNMAISCIDICEGGNKSVRVAGWAFDPDTSSKSVAIHVYVDDKFYCDFVADGNSPDVDSVYGISGKHRFDKTISVSPGKHKVVVFALDTGGDYRCNSGNGPYDVTVTGTNIGISNVTVTNLSSSGYTVNCYVTNGSTIASVYFPTWTVYNDQDDLIWHVATKTSSNCYSFTVETSDHKNETGSYKTDIYVYDVNGSYAGYSLKVTVPNTSATATTVLPSPTPASTPTATPAATSATTTNPSNTADTTTSVIPKLTSGVAHVQDTGDVSATIDSDGMLTLGTINMGKRLEQITINFENNSPYSGTLQYRVHVQDIGWMEWTEAGQKCGTEGMGKRIEAIEIRLTGELSEYYSVQYCAYIQDYGYMQGWVHDGAIAGTSGEAKRIEELKIKIIPLGTDSSMTIKYRVHVQDYGWEGAYASNGQMSGTSGESKRLEGIEIFLDGTQYSGGIKYKTHVQDYGWQGWSYDGEMSGTQGEAKRLEGICIELYGEIAEYYDIYYRVHAQDIGWMAWAKNGECAGTAGRSARLEGIQIVLVPKGEPAPGATYEGITAVTDKAFVEGF